MSEFRFTRPSNFPPVVRGLIIVNVCVWVLQLALDKTYDITDRLALWPIGSPLFRAYQVVTHMFAHASYSGFGGTGTIVFYHILFNMLGLWMFGRILENVWGGKRFLHFYFISGFGAAIINLFVQYLTGSADPVIGASGAIMGVLAAFAYLFPNTELLILPIPFPIKAKWAVIGFAAYDLFFGFRGGDNVAHFAHLGGALTGLIIVMIWNKKGRQRFY